MRLTPFFDQVVGHVENSEVLQALDSPQLLNTVIGDPQLFQCVPYCLLLTHAQTQNTYV